MFCVYVNDILLRSFSETDSPDFESAIKLDPTGQVHEISFRVYDVDGGREEVEIGRVTATLQDLLKADGETLAFQLSNRRQPGLNDKLHEQSSCVKVTPFVTETVVEPEYSLGGSFEQQVVKLRDLSKNIKNLNGNTEGLDELKRQVQKEQEAREKAEDAREAELNEHGV